MDPALAAECTHKLTKQKALVEALERGDSEVARFYDDATIFVTGGSGFLGKQLIEKLFRSCNIRRIYFLLREKKDKTLQMRLEEILSDPVFDTLHEQKPNFVSKILIMNGDVGELNLGLSEEDWKKITEEVHVIFHVAATVNFNADMVPATLVNVRGTREVLNMGRACVQLRSMVYVSTAFSHATKSRIRKNVDEDFYETPVSPAELIKMAENNDIEHLNELFKTRGEDWPNTYAFTKAVAEEVVRSLGEGLPVCVVRPATVIAAYREPSPGWMDSSNVYGASGLALGSLNGYIHILHGDQNARIDLVPVDIVNNASIVAAYQTAKTYTIHKKTPAMPNKIKIYVVTNRRKPLLLGDITRNLISTGNELTSPTAGWYSFLLVTKFNILYDTLFWLLHYIPAAVVDCLLLIIGRKPRILKIYKKIRALSSVLSCFMINDWIFHDRNTVSLHNNLCSTDKDLFNCDITSVDNNDFIEIWILGLRRYIMKDGLQGTEYGRKKNFYQKILHYFVFTIYMLLMIQSTRLIVSLIHSFVTLDFNSILTIYGANTLP